MTINIVERQDIIDSILDSFSENGTLTDEQKQILEELSKDNE